AEKKETSLRKYDRTRICNAAVISPARFFEENSQLYPLAGRFRRDLFYSLSVFPGRKRKLYGNDGADSFLAMNPATLAFRIEPFLVRWALEVNMQSSLCSSTRRLPVTTRMVKTLMRPHGNRILTSLPAAPGTGSRQRLHRPGPLAPGTESRCPYLG